VAAVHRDLIRDRREVRERRLLEREAMDLGPIGNEALGEMATRETGDAGDEHAWGHARRLARRDARGASDEKAALARDGQREVESIDLERELRIAAREPFRPALRAVIGIEPDRGHLGPIAE